jgi:hypothetical protein
MSDDRGGFRPAPRAKNPMDNTKLSLRAPNSKGKMASLQWNMVNNNPRIIVYTNDPDDQNTDYGKIQSHLDLPMMYAVIELIERCVNLPAGEKATYFVDNKKYSWAGGKRSDTPTVTDSIVIGRDEDGTTWISLNAPRRPKIKFPFVPPEFHHFRKADGSSFSQGEASEIMAKTYVRMLSQVVAAVNVKEYVHPEKKDNAGGGGGGFGGGNRSGGGGGGYGGGNRGGNSGGGAPAADVGADDDMPW